MCRQLEATGRCEVVACSVQGLILDNTLVLWRVDVRGQRVRFTGRIYGRIPRKWPMSGPLVLGADRAALVSDQHVSTGITPEPTPRGLSVTC